MRYAALALILLICPSVLFGQADDRLKKAEARLKEDSDDPEANLVVGIHFILRSDWNSAIPHLLKGSNEFFKALAEKEISGTDPLSIAESYMSGSTQIETQLFTGATATAKVDAKKEAAKLRPLFGSRALYWYGRAWDSMTDKQKVQIRPQIKKMQQRPVVQQPIQIQSLGGYKTVFGKVSLCLQFAVSGKQSVRLDPDPKLANSTLWSQSYAAKPGTEFVFSAWVLTDGTEGTKDEILMPIFAANRQLIAQPTVACVADTPLWRRYEIKGMFPQNAETYEVYINMVSRKGYLLVDDLSVKVNNREEVVNSDFESK